MELLCNDGLPVNNHILILILAGLKKQSKQQIYGSQVRQNEQPGKNEFFSIRDEANVNKRRASVRPQPLEEYAKFFGFDYVWPNAKQPQK